MADKGDHEQAKSNKLKQSTLGYFNFTKTVKVGGKLYPIKIDDLSKEEYGQFCSKCSQRFKSEQYLILHNKAIHPSILTGEVSVSVKVCNKEVPFENAVTTDTNEVVLNEVVLDEVENVCRARGRQKSKAGGRKGSRKRKSYSLHFKQKILKELSEISKAKTLHSAQTIIADKYGIHKSVLSKWKSQENKIVAENDSSKAHSHNFRNRSCASTRTRKRLTAPGKSTFLQAQQKLFKDFKSRRSLGLKVSRKWLRIRMKQCIESIDGIEAAEKFKGSQNWLNAFMKRHSISIRRRTNKKRIGNSDKLPVIQRFHKQLRKSVSSQRKRESKSYDLKWGRWLPKKRYNVDQVLLPFVVDQSSTFEEKGSKSVWVRQVGSGLDKRQCTLQLCIRPEGSQIPPAIIFRGAGNVKQDEKARYDQRVHVYFQKNAWMDGEVTKSWVENTFAPNVDKAEENVLFLDNLSCQVSEDFYKECSVKANTVLYTLPPEETDKVQPIDQGEGYLIKKLIGAELDKYLEVEANYDKWCSGLTAGERRVLITKWVANAWETINLKYPNFRRKLFLKTGLLMTADGSGDEHIRPQGFENYSF